MGKPPKGQDRVRLEQHHLDALRAEIARTSVGLRRLFRESNNVPPGLNLGQVQNWLDGHNETVRRDYLEWALTAWEHLPDGSARVEITPAILAELVDCRNRSGLGPTALLHDTRRDRPPSLNSGIIHTWLESSVHSASEEHLSYVLHRWQRLATERQQRPTPKRRGRRPGRIGPLEFVPIAPEMRAELRRLQQETGLGPDDIVDGSRSSPPATLVDGWLSGEIKLARKDQLDFVLKRWRDAASAPRNIV